MPQQKGLRGADQAALLCDGDTRRGAAMPVIGPLAHFDEHQRLAVLHDEVKLAALAPEIALDQRQAALLEIGKRLVLTSQAGTLPVGEPPDERGQAHS